MKIVNGKINMLRYSMTDLWLFCTATVNFGGPADKTVTASVCVQQRDRLLSETLDFLLHEFKSQCRDTKLYRGKI